jgi:hypothetical protein
VNRAGGLAYTQDSKTALASLMLTSFLTDQYYRDAQSTVLELVRLIHAVDPLFAAKAAVFARTRFGMRSVTHVVAGETASRVKGEQWPKRFYEAVVTRPDDVTEILGYYSSAHGLHPLPNSLKKGLARALRGFDDYELAKYRADRQRISLVDAVNLCRPRPTPSLTRLMSGTLPPADTWEVALTQAGQSARRECHRVALKRRAWRRLLREDKLGYLALLRNLRNIVQTGDEECIALAAHRLADRDALRRSQVFPIRIHTALTHLQPIAPPTILRALELALELAFDNVPVLNGQTLVAVDASGSMVEGGCVPPIDKAILFAAGIVKRSRCDIMLFSNDAELVAVDPADSIAVMSASLRARVAAAGTNFTAIFERANEAYDRIIILSDMQAWIEDERGHSVPASALARYRSRTGADPHIYAIDLSGYGTSQLPAGRLYQLAGFSEKLFDLMPTLEQDRDALVHTIEAINL